MPLQVNYNGNIIVENLVHISPVNQSFRYGDGCFETMQMIDGILLLQEYHFERLYNSLDKLKLKIPANLQSQNLLKQIKQLTEINNHKNFARIRLTIYRKGENFSKLCNDGGYIITGFTTYGSPNTDVFLCKTDSIGNMIWLKTYGGTLANEVQQTADGGFILIGNYTSNNISDVYFLNAN